VYAICGCWFYEVVLIEKPLKIMQLLTNILIGLDCSPAVVKVSCKQTSRKMVKSTNSLVQNPLCLDGGVLMF